MISTRKIVLLSIIVILIIGTIGVIGFRVITKAQRNTQKNKNVQFVVQAQTLKKETVTEKYTFPGLIQGDPQVVVYSNTTGNFIRNAVDLGTRVNRNQPIAYIDRNIIGANYMPAIIQSPIAGLVTKLNFVDRGAYISLNTPVAEVANVNNIKVVINIGEEYLLKIKKNMPAVVYSIIDKKAQLNGFVSAITPFIDTNSFTGTMQIKAKNTASLLSVGMSVNVDVTVGQLTGFFIPQSAVTAGVNNQFIFLNQNGIAKVVTVTLGYRFDDRVQINGNLKEGDQVVVVGSFKLYDGAQIKTAQ